MSDWTAANVKAEVHDAAEPSPWDTLDAAFADSKEWVPYEGPRGGEGWENTETGERVYGEKPGDDGRRDLAGLADEEGLLDADDLQAGDEVVIYGDEVTLDDVVSDQTGTIVLFQKDGEDYFLYEDMIDIEVPGFDSNNGSAGAGGAIEPDPDPGSDDPLQFERGDEIESPEGEPATVVDFDPETGVIAYETESTSEPMLATAEMIAGDDGPDTDSADEELADELGVEWAHTDGLDNDQLEAITSAFDSYREDRSIGNQSVISVSTTPPDDVGMAAGASFTPNERKLYVNPDGLNADTKRDDYEAGYIATETVEGSIHHELSHAEHFQNVSRDPDLDWEELRGHEFTDGESELITDEVSWYASTSASELVAEVNSGILEGESYSDEIMDLYNQFGGPEVNA